MGGVGAGATADGGADTPEAPTSAAGLIVDANVLVDFCESDRAVLPLLSRHLGRVHVPAPVLDEVDQLGAAECAALEVTVVSPSLDLAVAAGERRLGLSFVDHLCLLLARAHGFRCVTNDGRLRRECAVEGVPVLWGLESLALLVERGGLTSAEAVVIARATRRSNPRYITDAVLERFCARVAAVEAALTATASPAARARPG